MFGAMEGALATPGGAGQLGVGEILGAAFDLYRKQAANLWTIVALILLPAQVLVWIIDRVSLTGITVARSGTIYTSGSTVLPALAVVVIGFLAGVLTIGALSKCLVDAYTEHPTDWRHSLAFAGNRLGPLLVLAILSGVLLAIGYILLIIPGIYLTVTWSVATPALIFEGIGGVAALKRSYELVKGRWWVTFGALLAGLVAVIAASFIITLILGGIASSGSVDVILTLGAISRFISALLTYPLLAAIAAVIYVDLRARKEGVQAHDLVQSEGSPAGAGVPSFEQQSGSPPVRGQDAGPKFS